LGHEDSGRAGHWTSNPVQRRSGRPTRALQAAGLAAAMLLTSCATGDEVRYGEITELPTAWAVQAPGYGQPLSIGELIVGLRAGQTQEELVQAVRTRGLLAVASADDIDLLLEAGAGPDLIDAVHAVSADIAAASSETVPYATVPALPSTTIVTPPVYVAPPLYPGYYGHPALPWATFGFSYQYHTRPRRIDRPQRPPRPEPPHPRPPYGQAPHTRPPGPHPGASQTRPPRTTPPAQTDAPRTRPPLRPDEGTPGRWHSRPSYRSSPGTGPSRPYTPPSQYGHGQRRR